MTTLKLFISHSSRLDDIEHECTDCDRNWELLKKTCKLIRDKYGDRIEVLVDIDGLIPGDDWNHNLNLWLAECHLAIILFSERAIKKSYWVAKEASILSWRAELEENFKLIPVLLDGVKAEDLANDFLGVLKIDSNQCIRDAQTVEVIFAGIVKILGEPDDLASDYPQTPLELLQGGIAELLNDKTTEGSLRKALESIGCAMPIPIPTDKKAYANLLARAFLQTLPASVGSCSSAFKKALSQLIPAPFYDRARELFKYIRPLWVEPADASPLRLAKQLRYPVALNGLLISWPDKELRTSCYTLERFIERAWPGPESDQFLAVSITEAKPVVDVQIEIRRKFLGGGPLPPSSNPGGDQDRAVNRDGRTIVLLIFARSDKGGIPDPTFMRDLITLFGIYENFMLVFDVGDERPALPAPLKAAQPRLDDPNALSEFLSRENEAFYDELTTKTFLDNKYGIAP